MKFISVVFGFLFFISVLVLLFHLQNEQCDSHRLFFLTLRCARVISISNLVSTPVCRRWILIRSRWQIWAKIRPTARGASRSIKHESPRLIRRLPGDKRQSPLLKTRAPWRRDENNIMILERWEDLAWVNILFPNNLWWTLYRTNWSCHDRLLPLHWIPSSKSWILPIPRMSIYYQSASGVFRIISTGQRRSHKLFLTLLEYQSAEHEYT